MSCIWIIFGSVCLTERKANLLIILVFLRWNLAVPKVFTSKGKTWKKKQQNIHSPISGWSKIHAYLTKTKTVLKLEDNAHNEHQHIPQTSTEYSQGTSVENINTTGKQEVIHSSINATNKHNVIFISTFWPYYSMIIFWRSG